MASIRVATNWFTRCLVQQKKIGQILRVPARHFASDDPRVTVILLVLLLLLLLLLFSIYLIELN